MMVVVAMMMVVVLFFHHHCVRLRRRGPLHGDGDDLGLDRRLERNMGPVAEHELQRVLAGRQCHSGLGLAFAEVNMLLVDHDGLGHFLRRERLVDEQVMMPDVCLLDAGRSDAHVRA